MTADSAVLTASGVAVSFWGNQVLTGVNLAFTQGFNGLIGPNGAGKTTLFNVISGYVEPTAGSIEIEGIRVSGLGQAKIAMAGVSRTFQSPRLVLDATVMENTLLGRHARYRWGHFAELIQWPGALAEERRSREICMQALAQFGLADLAHAQAGSLSLGSQKLVEVVRALASEPKVVLLDEPAAGLGAEDVDVMLKGLRAYANSRPLCVVIIEHDLELVSSLCHTVSVLDYGEIIASGPPSEVTRKDVVIEAYLGSGFKGDKKKLKVSP